MVRSTRPRPRLRGDVRVLGSGGRFGAQDLASRCCAITAEVGEGIEEWIVAVVGGAGICGTVPSARARFEGFNIKAIGADAVTGNFLTLLVQKKRAAIIPEIAESFQVMVDEDKNISHGMVVSAIELTAELREKIQDTLEKLTGKKVELTASVDPSIIGGIVAKVGDVVLDGSIRTQLASLKDSIKGRE